MHVQEVLSIFYTDISLYGHAARIKQPNFLRKLSVYLRLLSAKRYEHAQKTINSRLGKKVRDRCRI